MKITNFNTGFNGNNQYGKSVKGSSATPDHIPGYRKASGGEDFLEISDEAVKRHKEAKILSFEEGRRKKEAQTAINSADNINSTEITKAGKIKDMIADNKYDFNNRDILSETADRVLVLIG